MSLNDFNEIKNTLKEEFDDFWNENILKSELENESTNYVVAKDNGEIVGFAGILILPDSTEITNIVVKKVERRKGIGKLLLGKLIHMSRKMNKESISLEVNEKNINAINLYEKQGFERVGLRKNYYEGKYNAIIMTNNFAYPNGAEYE